MHNLPHEPRFGRLVRVTMLQTATKLIGVDASVTFHDACICWMTFMVCVVKRRHQPSRAEQGSLLIILTYVFKNALIQLIDVRLQACADTAD